MQSEKLPALPAPHGVVFDGTPGVLRFQREPLTTEQSLFCSSDVVFSRKQMRDYALAARKAALSEVEMECHKRFEEMSRKDMHPYLDGARGEAMVIGLWVKELMEQDK